MPEMPKVSFHLVNDDTAIAIAIDDVILQGEKLNEFVFGLNGEYSEPPTAFPNPLWIELGDGKIGVGRIAVPEGNGLVLRPLAEAHEIGSYGVVPDGKGEPQGGDVFILCKNRESALVLQNQANEVVRAFDIRSIPNVDG